MRSHGDSFCPVLYSPHAAGYKKVSAGSCREYGQYPSVEINSGEVSGEWVLLSDHSAQDGEGFRLISMATGIYLFCKDFLAANVGDC